MSRDLAMLKGWELAPPPGAMPLRHMLFAHPDIVREVVAELGPLAYGSYDPPGICYDGSSYGERWYPDGYEMNRDGEWVERGEDEWSPESVLTRKQHWECPRSWSAALRRFLRLLEDRDLVLTGRPGSALSPGTLIPITAVASDAFQSGSAFASGIIELVDATKAYDVHIVRVERPGETFAQGSAFEGSIRKMRSEADLRSWLVDLMQRYPKNKPTSKAALLMMLDTFGVTKGEFRRAWDAACAAISPEIAAHWRSAGTLKKANRLPESISEI